MRTESFFSIWDNMVGKRWDSVTKHVELTSRRLLFAPCANVYVSSNHKSCVYYTDCMFTMTYSPPSLSLLIVIVFDLGK